MDALLLFHIWKRQTRTECSWRCEIASPPSISGDLADAANLVFWSWSHPLSLSTHWSAVPPDESLSWGTLWGFIFICTHFLAIIFLQQASYAWKWKDGSKYRCTAGSELVTASDVQNGKLQLLLCLWIWSDKKGTSISFFINSTWTTFSSLNIQSHSIQLLSMPF